MVFLTQKKCAIGSGHQLEFLGVAVVLFYHFTQKIKWIHIEVKYWVGLDKARRRWQGGEGGTKAEVDPPWFISFSQLCFSCRPQPNIMGAKPDSSLEKWCCSKQTNSQMTEKCRHPFFLFLSVALTASTNNHLTPWFAVGCLYGGRDEKDMSREWLSSI